jgi:hypothetical protein
MAKELTDAQKELLARLLIERRARRDMGNKMGAYAATLVQRRRKSFKAEDFARFAAKLVPVMPAPNAQAILSTNYINATWTTTPPTDAYRIILANVFVFTGASDAAIRSANYAQLFRAGQIDIQRSDGTPTRTEALGGYIIGAAAGESPDGVTTAVNWGTNIDSLWTRIMFNIDWHLQYPFDVLEPNGNNNIINFRSLTGTAPSIAQASGSLVQLQFCVDAIKET